MSDTLSRNGNYYDNRAENEGGIKEEQEQKERNSTMTYELEKDRRRVRWEKKKSRNRNSDDFVKDRGSSRPRQKTIKYYDSEEDYG